MPDLGIIHAPDEALHYQVLNGPYHHRFKNLSCDRRQHSLIVVLADCGENPGKLRCHWPEQDPQRNVHIL